MPQPVSQPVTQSGTRSGGSGGAGGSGAGLTAVVLVVFVLVLVAAVGIVVMALTGGGASPTATPGAPGVVLGADRDPETFVYTLPAGTAEMVAAGRYPIDLPSQLELIVGDTVTLVNHDRVDQWLGPLAARPGETVSITFTEPMRTLGECSFTSNDVVFVIRARGRT
jgi:hypothetical protein